MSEYKITHEFSWKLSYKSKWKIIHGFSWKLSFKAEYKITREFSWKLSYKSEFPISIKDISLLVYVIVTIYQTEYNVGL